MKRKRLLKWVLTCLLLTTLWLSLRHSFTEISSTSGTNFEENINNRHLKNNPLAHENAELPNDLSDSGKEWEDEEKKLVSRTLETTSSIQTDNEISSKTVLIKEDTFKESNQATDESFQDGNYGNEKYSLSYSLYGSGSWSRYSSLIYERITNIKKSKLYNKWTVRIFHEGLPDHVQKNLTSTHSRIKLHNVVDMKEIKFDLIDRTVRDIVKINGMTWRFIPLGDADVDVTCSRDLDSPLLEREEVAVKYWLQSGKLAHLMRDNPEHYIRIMGGLWCFRNSKFRIAGQGILFRMLSEAARRDKFTEAYKGDDQSVLNKYMWPFIFRDVIEHDSYHCKFYKNSEPFPTQKKENCSVGGFSEHRCGPIDPCPMQCRPKNHRSWTYC